jgi:intracellular sulfur oxidation DsrE/DsrF family protein
MDLLNPFRLFIKQLPKQRAHPKNRNTMKHILVLLIGLFLLPAAMHAQGKRHRMVFQFTNASDTLQQKAMVKQLQNLKEYWPDAEYEVVLYNQGVELLIPNKSNYMPALQKLNEEGVIFLVCENTLKSRQISKTVFPAWADFVPVGIAYIVERQEEGWTYIKGGY